jgi:hypothetical protein
MTTDSAPWRRPHKANRFPARTIRNRHGRTGAEIAKAVRISLPSVQNIKKALGLVKARA